MTTRTQDTAQVRNFLTAELGFEGKLTVSWTVAGGVLFGGFAVAVMTLMGRLSGQGLFVTSAVLFLMGAAFGFIHGGVLGFLGRDESVDYAQVLGEIARAVLYSIPALAVAWAVAGWIALTVVARFLDTPPALLGVGIGWLLGLFLLAGAAGYGIRGFRQAFRRWPDRVAGTSLVALGYVALTVLLLWERPELWWTGREVNVPGPMILAGGVTVWLIGPLVTLALRAGRKLELDRPLELVPGTPGRMGAGLAAVAVLGGGLGLALGAIFQPYGVLPLALWGGGLDGAVAVGLSQGFLDETLFRLVGVTAFLWIIQRWRGEVGVADVIAAVLVAAVLHTALYLPGLVQIGFAGTGTAVAYAGLALFVPALAYGVIFWRWGLASAVLAHAATVVVAALNVF